MLENDAGNLLEKRIIQFASVNSFIGTLLWVIVLLNFDAPKTAAIAFCATVSSVVSFVLIRKGFSLIARNVWVTVGYVVLFLASYLIDPAGQVIMLLMLMAATSFLIFSSVHERQWLIFHLLVISALWLTGVFYQDDFLGPREIGYNAASKYVFPLTAMTLFPSLMGVLFFFTFLMHGKNKELEIAAIENENANQAKSQFLANMSHEIRTPMNGVVGMADVLAESDLTQDQRKKLKTIKDSAWALLSIIDDILDFSKIEAGKMEIQLGKALLVEELERVCNTIRPMTEEANVRLHLSLTPEVMSFVEIDNTRLRQILMNLLSNAVKFSRGRGGKRGEVELHCELSEGDNIVFDISDNGIGMSEDTIDRLFTPFTQAEAGTTREFGGTGLGLSIVRNLTGLLGGTIAVESEVGVGSKFSVKIPCKKLPDQIILPDLSGLTVLAYVDEQASCDAIGAFLSSQGSTLEKIDYLDTLVKRAAQTEDGTIVLVAQENLAAHMQAIEQIIAANPNLKILNAVASHTEMDGSDGPNFFRLQRFPLLPSEFVQGLAQLSERNTMSKLPSNKSDERDSVVGLSILLVEDSLTNQLVISEQLKKLGQYPDVAEDGQQGFEKAKLNTYDLVISDCHMPKVDGFEMSRMIRRIEGEESRPAVPIIALTADAIRGIEERCYEAGMDRVITKPVRMGELQDAIEKTVSQSAGS